MCCVQVTYRCCVGCWLRELLMNCCSACRLVVCCCSLGGAPRRPLGGPSSASSPSAPGPATVAVRASAPAALRAASLVNGRAFRASCSAAAAAPASASVAVRTPARTSCCSASRSLVVPSVDSVCGSCGQPARGSPPAWCNVPVAPPSMGSGCRTSNVLESGGGPTGLLPRTRALTRSTEGTRDK